MSYTPDAADVIWIDFDPQVGHEQAKRRPAVVLTPKAYNEKTSLLICVPLTTKVKNYPFEVAISGEKDGVALADHVKNLNWRARNAKYKGGIPQEELGEIQEKLGLLLRI